MIEFPLSKLNSDHGNHVEDEHGLQVFHVKNSHLLTQAAGYLKHTLAIRHGKHVYFRGQTKLYKSLAPSLFRGMSDKSGNLPKRRLILNDFLSEIRNQNKALRSVKAECHEALLQHYGIRTSWLDVVDNVWIALWFACHNAIALGDKGDFLHFERRSPDYYRSNDPEYAYILLLESASRSVESLPGHYADETSETIDLRIAAPSHFVRPHAQHGILVRRLSKKRMPLANISPMIVGILRIDLPMALDWIGAASTLGAHSLFPPAYYDFGYRELLAHIETSNHHLGSIHRVQP